MLQRFKQFITQQHLVSDGHKVLLGVSGGRDSVCMTHLFHQAGIPFGIAHCNFHLRGAESDRDEAFVRQLSQTYQVPLHIAHFDTTSLANTYGMGIEEAARQLRYHYFATLSDTEGYACTAVAHHLGDSIETLLLNLMRTTGIGGLHGILPRVEMHPTLPDSTQSPLLVVVRPLLAFSRADVEQYVAEQGLAYVDDSTNASTEPRRNFVRHKVLPLLRQTVPTIDTILANNITHFHQAELIYKRWLVEQFERLEQQGTLQRDATTLELALPLSDEQFPSDVRPTMLYELLHPYGFNSSQTAKVAASEVSMGAHLRSATHLLSVGRKSLKVFPLQPPTSNSTPSNPTDLPPLILQPVSHDQVEPLLQRLRTDATFRQTHALMDAQKVSLPLSSRRWQAGDRFQPYGMTGTRLVSDFLKDLKLEPLQKRAVQVVVDAEGKIIWVPPYRTDARVGITPSTPSQSVLLIGLRNADSSCTAPTYPESSPTTNKK